MIIPVRCMSCGRPIAHLWADFQEKKKSKDAGEVLTELGLSRYCCRAQMLGHVDLIDVAAKFKKF